VNESTSITSGNDPTREELALVPTPAPTTTDDPGSPVAKSVSVLVNQVICGDCVQIMQKMPTECVDLVITDPPYIARYRDRSGRSVANDDQAAWLKPAFWHIAQVLKNNRYCISFYGWHKVDAFMAAWREAGFRPRAHFVWPKRYASGQKVVAYCHEQAFLLSKGDPPKPLLVLRDVLEWRYSGNVHHPTQKPLIALQPLIDAFSNPGDIVFDPFAGSCSTAEAAQQSGRQYIAIELESRYCQAARERLAAALLQTAL
jgi:adenine-specific DNA-methyltransferase